MEGRAKNMVGGTLERTQVKQSIAEDDGEGEDRKRIIFQTFANQNGRRSKEARRPNLGSKVYVSFADVGKNMFFILLITWMPRRIV